MKNIDNTSISNIEQTLVKSLIAICDVFDEINDRLDRLEKELKLANDRITEEADDLKEYIDNLIDLPID